MGLEQKKIKLDLNFRAKNNEKCLFGLDGLVGLGVVVVGTGGLVGRVGGLVGLVGRGGLVGLGGLVGRFLLALTGIVGRGFGLLVLCGGGCKGSGGTSSCCCSWN